MKRKTKETPEQRDARDAVASAERAELARQWAPFKRRAAHAVLSQPFALVGQDVLYAGLCAEALQWWGNKYRFETLECLAYQGVSDAMLRELVAGSDEFISDRMTAAWWWCLSSIMASSGRFYRDAKDPDAVARATLIRPIEALISDGLMRHEAISLLHGDGDRFHSERARHRRDLAAQHAELVALARET